VPGGYVFVDGSGVGDIGPSVMREREALARDGFVIVHLSIDPKTGRFSQEPHFLSRGFAFARDAEALFEQARARIMALGMNGLGTPLEEQVEKELSKFFYAETKRHPMIFVFTSTESL
jgi:ribonuclease J